MPDHASISQIPTHPAGDRLANVGEQVLGFRLGGDSTFAPPSTYDEETLVHDTEISAGSAGNSPANRAPIYWLLLIEFINYYGHIIHKN